MLENNFQKTFRNLISKYFVIIKTKSIFMFNFFPHNIIQISINYGELQNIEINIIALAYSSSICQIFNILLQKDNNLKIYQKHMKFKSKYYFSF